LKTREKKLLKLYRKAEKCVSRTKAQKILKKESKILTKKFVGDSYARSGPNPP